MTFPSPRILLVEGNPEYAARCAGMVAGAASPPWRLVTVDQLNAAVARLRDERFDLVLLGLSQSVDEVQHTLSLVLAEAGPVPVLVLAELEEAAFSARLVGQGATDYLHKRHLNGPELIRAIRNALHHHRLRQELARRALQLHVSEARFRRLIEDSADGLLVIDRHGVVRYVNRAALTLIGRPEDDLLGQALGVPLCTGSGAELDFVDREGTPRVAELRVVETIWEGETAYLVALRDLTAQKQLQADLHRARLMEQHLAYHDPLTGLANRQLFFDRLQHGLAQARRHQRLAAVLALDLDGLKQVNDSLGHRAGDCLLQRVAQRLRECIRASDTVARLGGDEFVLLVDDLHSPADAARVAEKVLHALASPVPLGDPARRLTASIGISLYPADSSDGEGLLRYADMAMHYVKAQGKNGYQFYEPSMQAPARDRLILESHLWRALGRDELVVHYQPQVDLLSGRIHGVEALVRWQHPERGLLGPAEFIPVAERSHLITAVDHWVLRTACRELRTLLPAVRVSVNLSARQFHDRDFLPTLADILRETGVGPEGLGLEITETHAMSDVTHTIALLQELKAMGVQLAVDDFGTGYSSLSYLQRFPIDVLKIDQSFVRRLPSHRDDVAITTALINLGHNLGLRVVAEGVETEEQQAFLKAVRCDVAQGYHVSRPLTAAQLAGFLRDPGQGGSPGGSRIEDRGSRIEDRGSRIANSHRAIHDLRSSILHP